MSKILLLLFAPKKDNVCKTFGNEQKKSQLLRNITDIPVITKVANASRTFEKFSDLLFDDNVPLKITTLLLTILIKCLNMIFLLLNYTDIA